MHEQNRVKRYRLNKHQWIMNVQNIKFTLWEHETSRPYRYFSVNSQWSSSVVTT